MKLVDFQMQAEQMLDDRSFTLLTRPVSEAIRVELGVGAPIEAPFGKLVVLLVPQGTDPWVPEHDGSVQQIRLLVDELRIREAGEETRTALLLDVAEEAVRRSEVIQPWDSSQLRAIVDRLRGRDDVGWIELDGLSRTVRGHGAVAFFYEVRPSGSALWAVTYGNDGVQRARFVVAEDPAPLPLEYFFPVSRAVVKGATVELRTRRGETLASWTLRDRLT
jgi:hypothetical protein